MIYYILTSLVDFSKQLAQNFGYEITKEGYLYLLLIQIGLVFSIFALFFVFRSLGLYKMAKREGLKRPWLALIPFAALFVAQELAPNSKYIKKNKYLYIVAIIAEGFSIFCSLVCDVLYGLPLLENIINGNNSYLAVVVVDPLPSVLFTMYSLCKIVYVIVSIILYSKVFKAYSIKHNQTFTVLSALSYVVIGNLALSGIFVFALRNKDRIDYDAYISERIRRQQAYRNSQYGNPYGRPPYGGNPYERPPYNGPYGENPYGGNQNANTSDPFEDFSNNAQSDPFEEFSNTSTSTNSGSNANTDDDLFN